MTQEAGAILYNGKKNVIWGAGKTGTKILFTLISFGVYTEKFCDSDKEKQGLRLYNKMVVPPDDILRYSNKFNIIIAVSSEDSIYEIKGMLVKYGVNEYVIWKQIGENACSISVKPLYLYWIIRDSYARKLIIYGYGQEGKQLQALLAMLNVEIACFVDDTEKERHDEWGNCIMPVKKLLFEERGSFKVVVTSEKANNTSTLDKMGFMANLDYGIWNNYAKLQLPRKYIFDVNMGFNFCCDGITDKLPGFVEWGNDGELIVLLGNSTTDGRLYPVPSWGELLYDKLRQNGYSIKILNGGCCGYRSSQELVKLIRDVIPLKPKTIIHYTGFNDAFQTPRSPSIDQNPFVHPQQITLFNEISEYYVNNKSNNNLMQYNMQWDEGGYTLGIAHGCSRWDMFTNNIKMMNCICQEYGVIYRAFLQPCIVTKVGKFSDYEKELLWNTKILRKESFKYIEDFYNHMKNFKSDFMEDMTSLFDDKGNVYMDYCHVTEAGNEVIAQYMYEYLLRENVIEK